MTSKLDYLKKYASSTEVDDGKKKRRRKKSSDVSGKRNSSALQIIDDEADIVELDQKKVEKAWEEPEPEEEKPAVVLDDMQEGTLRQSGSWTVVSNEQAKSCRVVKSRDASADASPPRRRRRGDSSDEDRRSSPHRTVTRRKDSRPRPSSQGSSREELSSRDDSPPRRPRHGSSKGRTVILKSSKHDRPIGQQSDDSSPPRTRRHDSSDDESFEDAERDSSPSRRRRRRHDSLESDEGGGETDTSPPRRPRHRGGSPAPADASPPRRRRRERDSSPVRRHKGDASTERRRRNSTDGERKRRHDSPDSDEQDVLRKAGQMGKGDINDKNDSEREKTASGYYAGLQSGKDFKAVEQELRRKKEEEMRGVDAEASGKGAETIYRDRKGRKLDMLNEFMRQQDARAGKAAREEKEAFEWGRGKVQKAQEKEMEQEMSNIAAEPFARSIDDHRLEAARKAEIRPDDPMAAYMAKKQVKAKAKKGIAVVPEYKGPPPKPNRFGIRPGYRWDGVDRGNGWEDKIVAKAVEGRHREELAYQWATADM